MPPCPSSMLYERQAMIAMPICDSIVAARLLVNSSGAHARTAANRPQTTKRPTLRGLKLNRAVAAAWLAMAWVVIGSMVARSEQPPGPEDQHQHEEKIGKDRRHLRQ